MIDGIWWLVILLIIIGFLWFIAHKRSDKQIGKHNDVGNKNSTKYITQKLPVNDALQKTGVMIKQHFSDYRVTRRESHLMLIRQGKKIAMITIDKRIAAGQRRLGDVPVINYHHVPNHAQLSASLKNAE